MGNGKKIPNIYQGADAVKVLVRHYRLKELREFSKNTKGMLVYIETFRDLSDVEKADIYDDATKQTKGEAPRTNPWRK